VATTSVRTTKANTRTESWGLLGPGVPRALVMGVGMGMRNLDYGSPGAAKNTGDDNYFFNSRHSYLVFPVLLKIDDAISRL